MRICCRTPFLVNKLGKTSSIILTELSSLLSLMSTVVTMSSTLFAAVKLSRLLESKMPNLEFFSSNCLLLLLVIGFPNWLRPSQSKDDAIPCKKNFNHNIVPSFKSSRTYISNSNSCSSQCYLICEYKICKTFKVWICAGLRVEEPPNFSSDEPANTEENKLEETFYQWASNLLQI